MSKNHKRFASFALILVMLSVLFVGCAKPASTGEKPTSPAEKAKKAALLLSGPINDGGWNTDAYNGLMKLKTLGYEVAYTENVQQADQDSVIRGYAKQGFTLIVGHGFEYGDSLAKVAKDYPQIKFFHMGGNAVNGTNLASGVFRLGDLSYVAAGIAARTTKTNKIGFVGAMAIPTIETEVVAIKERVKEVNSRASVTVAYTGSWSDINKGKEAALAQISNGVDVIIGIGDACDAGAIQACKEKGVKFIGWSGDLNSLAPEIVLTSGVQSVSGIIEGIGKEVLDNKFVAKNTIFGMAEGKAFLGTFSTSISPAVKEKAIKESEDIVSGTIKLPNRN